VRRIRSRRKPTNLLERGVESGLQSRKTHIVRIVRNNKKGRRRESKIFQEGKIKRKRKKKEREKRSQGVKEERERERESAREKEAKRVADVTQKFREKRRGRGNAHMTSAHPPHTPFLISSS
jgi:hypothetical protein